ncbi:MAG: NTP transferase domain-containing protein, partial [Nanoarchaeota archaeon]|nr:NTP transferase domain-containing protein [Nanoarchaeota archaeon]
MKAIIIAAGMGSRLEHLTKDKPKCLLEFCGKTLLEHQLTAIRNNNISNISLIKG